VMLSEQREWWNANSVLQMAQLTIRPRAQVNAVPTNR
jgi:hypothetical protein